MTENDRRITVRFGGASSGSGPLTLGQDNMVRCIRRDRPEQINKESVWPVPEGTTLPAALDALRALVERHDSLRTVFPPGPAPDGFPERQEVRAEGEFTVTVLDADGLGDTGLDLLADRSGRADVAVPFELASGIRLRFTLLADADLVRRLVVTVCHAGADGAATTLLLQDWIALAAGRELPPVTARTPLEVAALEHSDQGRRRTAASLRHWEKALATAPQAVFADSRITGPPEGLATVVLRSRAAAADLAAAAQRTGASPSVVLLAAFSALVAQRAGRSELVFAALSANRQRAVMADHVGTLAQDALLVLDTGTADLDQLIGRTKAASLAGYWHSTLDSAKVWQLIEDVAHLRGARFTRHVVVNDLSLTIPELMSDARPAPVADPELTWLPDQPLGVRVMLNVLRAVDCLEFVLLACPQVLDRAETERFARALTAVLEAAARGPVPLSALPALTGLRPAARTGDWHRIDNCWIDLDAVRGLVADALGAAATAVDVAGGRITARIATADPAVTPLTAHLAVVAALPGRDTAMAPHHYTVHALQAAPAAGARDAGVRDGQPPAGPPAWESLPVTGEGTGRSPEIAAAHPGLV
ncbi:condensation domain-containing protein [Kitasatospora sp. A2-31]|uniref:condensation domain-containing protein n=1 Tax=Kitasatospora sp. A2-31 TaxID=2916414 RepID=UPI0027E33168|nr:condensation domain-containing protein [Kitasatospora sp. A2-31]